MPDKINNPIREALRLFINPKVEIPAFVEGESFQSLSDDVMQMLQDFCSEYAVLSWATGLSIMDAAELLVESALENDNIYTIEEAD